MILNKRFLERITAKQALLVIAKKLKTDPSYREVWVANIAMAYIDTENRIRKRNKTKVFNKEARIIIANRAATNFIELLCAPAAKSKKAVRSGSKIISVAARDKI